MKVYEKTKVITICEKTAGEFDQKFNQIIQDLPAGAELHWEQTVPFCVHIIFKETVNEPETIADQFKLEGIIYKCVNCPYCEIGDDKRRKVWPCKHAKYGRTDKDSEACEYFFRLVKAGALEPLEVE